MTDLMTMAAQFGTPGFLIAFMIWQQKERSATDKDRISADIAVAEAITKLSERINHVR